MCKHVYLCVGGSVCVWLPTEARRWRMSSAQKLELQAVVNQTAGVLATQLGYGHCELLTPQPSSSPSLIPQATGRSLNKRSMSQNSESGRWTWQQNLKMHGGDKKWICCWTHEADQEGKLETQWSDDIGGKDSGQLSTMQRFTRVYYVLSKCMASNLKELPVKCVIRAGTEGDIAVKGPRHSSTLSLSAVWIGLLIS